jgi:glutamate synthase (NADPH/NADH) small chain
VLAVELVVEALGQQLPDELRGALESAGVRLDRGGLVEVGAGSWATSVAGIYAGGDLVNGGTTAVQGVREGLEAAGEIDAALTGRACKCQE